MSGTCLNASVPLEVVKASHKMITKEVRELDAPLLSRLEQAGFRLEFGEDGTGWPLKFRTRGGGYYFNVGCSELIADGKIRLIQAVTSGSSSAMGWNSTDSSTLTADLVVLATGYKGQDHIVGSLFGPEVAGARRADLGFRCRHPGTAQHVDSHRGSPDCGSPADRSRNAGSIRVSSRCRSMRSRTGGWKRR